MSISDLTDSHKRWMLKALREAERAMDNGEVPVGAVVVLGETIVGRGHNHVERLGDPTAHAEMIAITAACETVGQKYLDKCTLYVTLEPCPMCAGAMVLSKLGKLVFGAMDEKAGSASTLYNITDDKRLNHRVEVIGGIEAERSAELLKSFFVAKRS